MMVFIQPNSVSDRGGEESLQPRLHTQKHDMSCGVMDFQEALGRNVASLIPFILTHRLRKMLVRKHEMQNF